MPDPAPQPLKCKTVEDYVVNGSVSAVADGDTFTVKLSTGGAPQGGQDTLRIRLGGVDTPETKSEKGYWGKQPHSAEAKAFTTLQLLGKLITARVAGKPDDYGRYVGEVFMDGRSLNRELVRAGWAWWYVNYQPYDLDLQRLEQAARAARLGLWTADNPIAPWEWRSKGMK